MCESFSSKSSDFRTELKLHFILKSYISCQCHNVIIVCVCLYVAFVGFACVVGDAFYSFQCILQSFRVWFHFDLVRNIIRIHPKGDLFHFFIEIFVTFLCVFFWGGASMWIALDISYMYHLYGNEFVDSWSMYAYYYHCCNVVKTISFCLIICIFFRHFFFGYKNQPAKKILTNESFVFDILYYESACMLYFHQKCFLLMQPSCLFALRKSV